MLRLRIILLCDFLYYILAVISIFYVCLFISLYNHKSQYQESNTIFEGIITDYKIDGNLLSIELKALEKLKVNYTIKNEEEKNYLTREIKHGKRLEIQGELTKPINNTVPNTFNYKKYLEHNKIYWIVKTDSYKIFDDKISVFYQCKNFINSQMKKASKSQGYLGTFIFGDKTSLDNETYLNYQKNGVSHLIALSGMYVSLFADLIIKFLEKLKRSELFSHLIAFLFLLFYAAMTSFTPSILRPCLFLVLSGFNKIYYTHIKPLNLLIVTGCILIIINPFIIYDLGFQYSYIISFGLIFASKNIESKNYIVSLLKVSIVAFLFSVPISLVNFYELNFFSIINNLVFVPIISVIIYPLTLLIFFIPVFDSILYFFLKIIEYLNTFAAKITFLTINVPKISYITYFIFYFLLCLTYKLNKKYALLLVEIVLYSKYKYNFDSNYYVSYIDIGQGDCALVRHSYNKETILIDTGGKIDNNYEEWAKRNTTYNISDNYITFMKSIGITKIDKLILTHGDEDHLGETLNLIKNIKIKEIIMNHGELNKNEIEIINNFTNVKFEITNTKFNIKALNKTDYKDENENSKVLLLTIEDYNLLFMGDSGHIVEENIIKEYNIPKIDVLKLGHHGSKNSSSYDFLKKINPDIAIISAGRNNRYNHPSKIVIDYLEELDVNYHNTQTEGTIVLKISSKAHTFLFFPP